MPVLRFLLLGLILAGGLAHAGMTTETPYTSRGKTDFDTALRLLNPYGTWSKIDGAWAYTPLNHFTPYTSGRWLYTEYGWLWKGNAPHSWATEHYGFWKRGANKVWSWYPGPYWLPQIVEIRATEKYLGWRCAEVDDSGNFVEQPIDRFSKTDEWTFVTLKQFANPITPAVAAPVDVAREQLENSTGCRHTYMTYRIIDRPGPHPADFADLNQDGGMLAPATFAVPDAAPTPVPVPAPVAATNAAVQTDGTNQPSALGQPVDPSADSRKVHYWVTMSLPNLWAAPPPDAKSNEIYIYRPDFFQDQDGIKRRITLWFNPNERTSLREALGGAMSTSPNAAAAAMSTNHAGTPAVPAVPAVPEKDPARNPFRSPLDQADPTLTPLPSTNTPPKGGVPTGRANEGTK